MISKILVYVLAFGTSSLMLLQSDCSRAQNVVSNTNSSISAKQKQVRHPSSLTKPAEIPKPTIVSANIVKPAAVPAPPAIQKQPQLPHSYQNPSAPKIAEPPIKVNAQSVKGK